jgi:hypothetical protein
MAEKIADSFAYEYKFYAFRFQLNIFLGHNLGTKMSNMKLLVEEIEL